MCKVSIVVPNYNHARYLPKRIETILRQTYQDFELILLDDCSTDDSRRVLSRYEDNPRVRLEFNDVNSGSPFKQWNRGVCLARGAYVWIAESDDYADERFLERLVPSLERDESIVYAYCRSCRVTEDGQLSGFEDTYIPHQGPRAWTGDYSVDGKRECLEYFLFVNAVPNASAVLLRKSAYDLVKGADESLVLCGDWKLWAALALTGRIEYLSEPLNYYRNHGVTQRSRTGRKSVSVSESLRVVKWIMNRMDLCTSECNAIYKAHAAGWVPELLSMHVPLRVKATVWHDAKAMDPHPIRRILIPAIETARKSFVRRYKLVRSGFANPAALPRKSGHA
ncbi:MAG TPA: glycosyltransferase [Terriglobales bacterium]|nr:glycosyltransferase [Terriglobales bacterium]